MSSYSEEKCRRIAQFAEYLRLMGLRTHKVVKGDSFIVFDESNPADSDSPRIKESIALRVDCLSNGNSIGEDAGSQEVPSDTGWSGKSSSRFIQFAFRRDCFYLELPNSTVFPNEVDQILRDRTGFFYALNRTDLPWVRGVLEDMVKWDPLQKVYLYRDEESAAEDMAFILYQVWKFPVDWRWYVKAAAFGTGHRFEQGKPLD